MSGTSADAIDAALVNICDESIRFEAGISQRYPEAVRASILARVSDPHIGLAELCQLESHISAAFAEATHALLDSANLASNDICAIGSHGQTLIHQPTADPPFTLQLSNASLIAQLTKIDTVADFRRADIAAGGQGAPLVPAFHAQVFGTNPARVILNLGGIANITILSGASVTGFDTGPANTLLDAWCRLKRKRPFDESGTWARSGTVNEKLLDRLRSDSFFHQTSPKSTGPDYFNLDWLYSHAGDMANVPDEDVQATLTELTAVSVIEAIQAACQSTIPILACGGGAQNTYLIERLSQLAGNQVRPTSDLGVDCDYCEAMAFAWLAYQFKRGRPGNLAAVTGASRGKILGGLFPAS